MNLSIRWKVTLGALLAIASGLTVAGWLALRSVEQAELERTAEALNARAALVAFSLISHASAADALLPQLTRELSRQANARITIVSPDGTVRADSDTADENLSRLENHGSRPEIQQALQSGRGTDIRLSQTTGQRLFYLARLIETPQTANRMIVRLSIPLPLLDSRIHEMQKTIALAFGVAFLVSVAFSVFLVRGLTLPLTDMARVARQFAAGAFGQRMPSTSRDEIGVLATTLNSMAEQLETKIREVSDDRAQLLAILSSMVEGIMVLDGSGKVLQVNVAWEHMFGLRGEQIKGASHEEIFRNPDLNALTRRVIDSRESQGREIVLTPARRMFRVEASPVAGGEDRNKAWVVLVFYDVTALRRLEQVRKDFVANVSHELRTPLTSIKGYVEALLDGGKDDPVAATRYLEIILKQSDRLNLLLDDLLQLSQIESGLVAFKQDRIALEPVIDRALAMIRPLADKKGHRLTITLAPDLPPVRGDAERLGQVLTNLLDNAVKYTPPNGEISVSTRLLAPDSTLAIHGQVELSVTDTGIGIPESDRPRVFERFYRVDKARSREMGGTGLGLAIVKHIVEAHGGHVWVESNSPTGSRFVVRLPLGHGEPDPRDRRAQPATESAA